MHDNYQKEKRLKQAWTFETELFLRHYILEPTVLNTIVSKTLYLEPTVLDTITYKTVTGGSAYKSSLLYKTITGGSAYKSSLHLHIKVRWAPHPPPGERGSG